MEKKLVIWLKEVTMNDVPLVGGKNASLGEMMNALSSKGVNVPNGFTTTSEAYWYFLDYNNLREKIKEVLKDLDVNDVENLQRHGLKVRNLIRSGEFPPDLKEKILEYYHELSKEYGQDYVDVAIRSSATAKDTEVASFAGHNTIFNTRRKTWFWVKPWPSPTLFWATVGTSFIGTVIAVYGFDLITPVGWKWGIFIWGYAMVWFLFNDTVKVFFFHIYRNRRFAFGRFIGFKKKIKSNEI
ncbi:PEP/pyruvate-binding domain-containing protein [Persephonella sp.]|uniref:PEP/pyruvate-binding domain-containing protein n=1 Tax=Persephonella sp. TaxID=2060922 RepID=UPI0025F3FC62|nr:PEP/pyruvate-binding domain-containing protein [Persephonella sp.]